MILSDNETKVDLLVVVKQLYTSSWQAPYHSFRRKRQNSFILLPLLSPQSFATLRGPREVIAFSEGSSPEGYDLCEQ